MTTAGFNQNQTKQLSDMFEHVVNSLSEVIQESEARVTEKLESKISDTRNELKQDIAKVREDLNNYVAITPTKYQVERLEKAVFGKVTA